ncbi:GreA/GreB family elongation factor [Devosia sediminis]|uniref:GreA/GreB family elongation factor n=1 Tax=Devosia sediminis TaxID=2798801 RepID=A0A934J0Z9_9HYPH|nr:GreA/GreB family elongation factor [Devosia sediminis]MBJ3786283.1 GreA/GreB family elongation factor [Devosia sediminis]
MTTISLADWSRSPEIMIGAKEHKRLTIAALTEIGDRGDSTDFLLHELDRARIVDDSLLPPDRIRVGSIVRFKPIPGKEQTIKLVMPGDENLPGNYRLSATSLTGAALLGLRPGDLMSWLSPDGVTHRIKVLKVANTATAPDGGDDPGPSAA